MGEKETNDTDQSNPDAISAGTIDLVEILRMLWDARSLFVRIVVGSTLTALSISFLIPNYYRSSATILPETDNKLAPFGGLSDLAALAGVNLSSEGSLAKLYPSIIKSEEVLRDVIYAEYRVNGSDRARTLIEVWDLSESDENKSLEHALEEMRDRLDVSLDSKTNIVSIEVETYNPELSADIANRIVKRLDEFMRTQRTNNASEQRKWIEERLMEVALDLEKSENALKEFRENNRRVLDSPKLLLEQERLRREVEINATIHTELKKQLELVKIEEIKNTPIINVMDFARPSAFKSGPKRVVISLVTLVLSSFLAFALIVLRHQYDNQIKRIFEALKIGRKADERTRTDVV